MLVKNIKTKIIGLQKVEGTSNGKSYKFYSAVFLDEDFKTLKINLSNDLGKDEALITKLSSLKDVPVVIELSLHQSGFNIKGTVVGITV